MSPTSSRDEGRIRNRSGTWERPSPSSTVPRGDIPGRIQDSPAPAPPGTQNPAYNPNASTIASPPQQSSYFPPPRQEDGQDLRERSASHAQDRRPSYSQSQSQYQPLPQQPPRSQLEDHSYGQSQVYASDNVDRYAVRAPYRQSFSYAGTPHTQELGPPDYTRSASYQPRPVFEQQEEEMLRSHGGGYAEDSRNPVSPLYAPAGKEGEAYEDYGRRIDAPPPRERRQSAYMRDGNARSRRESADNIHFEELGPHRKKGGSAVEYEDEEDERRRRRTTRESGEGRRSERGRKSMSGGRSTKSRRVSGASDDQRPTMVDSMLATASGIKSVLSKVNKKL